MSRILLNPLVDISVGSKRDISVLMLKMVGYPGIVQGWEVLRGEQQVTMNP